MSHIVIRRASVGLLVAVAALLVTLFASVTQASARPLALDGTRTQVTLVPTALDVLLGAGIVPLPVDPSPVAGTPTSLRYTFPVTGGRVDSKTLAGSIRHSGGVLFVQRAGSGWNTLKLTSFTINIGNESYITAKVNGGARVRVLELDLTKAVIKQYVRNGRTFVSVSKVGVGLNATAINAVNATFGTALPTDDVIPFGTANVLARVARAH